MARIPVRVVLERGGYIRDPECRIWRRAGTQSIRYSDGDDAEARLAKAVAAVRDHSVSSPEWAHHIVDWPSEYHFSRLRCNLLRPIPIRSDHRVLELGAGCGALTRWMGELGAEIIAVEGSMRRAAIIADRCRDLPNVHVVADNLHGVPSFEADWVTLIGVLEYARVFHTAADAVADTLVAARNHLTPGGALVVAIENQLGLKYFAGCREDHLGTRFSGIQGQYAPHGPVTFGRRELAAPLAAAGFNAQRFLMPFPDYKLPTTVVNEVAAKEPEFDVAAVVAATFVRDYEGALVPTFREALVWNGLRRNGLIADLANSFLVIACELENSLVDRTPDPSTLAWAYSLRPTPYSVLTRFVREPDALRVRKESLEARNATRAQRWRHHIEPVTDYFAGELLSFRMLRAAEAQDEPAFFQAGLLWIDMLLERSTVPRSTSTRYRRTVVHRRRPDRSHSPKYRRGPLRQTTVFRPGVALHRADSARLGSLAGTGQSSVLSPIWIDAADPKRDRNRSRVARVSEYDARALRRRSRARSRIRVSNLGPWRTVRRIQVERTLPQCAWLGNRAGRFRATEFVHGK